MYDNQFQHWNSEFQPHEIGQIPLVGNHKPYNNAFVQHSGQNKGVKPNDDKTLQNDAQTKYLNVPNKKLNNVQTNTKANNEYADGLSIDDRSVSYDGR